MQILEWDDTHQLLLSPQGGQSVLQFCSLLPETESQDTHTLQHTGARLQYVFSVRSRLLSSLNIISGVYMNFFFFKTLLICQVLLPDIKEINVPSLNTTPGSFERLPFLDVGLLSSSPQPVSPAASFNRMFQIRTDNPYRLTCFLQCLLLTSECC